MKKLESLKKIIDDHIEDVKVTPDITQKIMHSIEYPDKKVMDKNESTNNKSNFFNRKKRILSISAASAVILVAALSFIFIFNSKKPDLIYPDAKIIPLSETAAGVNIDTDFLLSFSSNSNYSLEDIKDLIVFEPKIDYDISKMGANEYKITPQKELDRNKIYKISLNSDEKMSWAFQTESNLKIQSTVPADINNGYYNEPAPIDTGIEVTFSSRCQDVSNYFEIFPKVEGDFKYKNKTAIFVPKTKLKEKQKYTVTIKKGLTSESGKPFKEDYTFSFVTSAQSEESDYNLYIHNYCETFLPDDPICVRSYHFDKYESVDVSVYQLKDEKEYLKYAEKRYDNAVPADRGKILTAKCEIVNNDRIILPENLACGFYLINISDGSQTIGQQLMQVSEIAVYIQSSSGQTLFWLNDTSTGKPIAGADVNVKIGSKEFSVKTDGDGVAVVESDTCSYDDSEIIITSKDGKKYADKLLLRNPAEKDLTDDYYFYLYTDRNYYKPDDTIYFYGNVFPKRDGVKMPEKITISCPYIDGGERELTVKSNGSFEGSISYKDADYSVYMGFMLGNQSLGEVYKSICDYDNAVYLLETKNTKSYFKKDEPISVDLAATFYDNTPANNLQLAVENNSDGTAYEITLDKNGKGRYESVIENPRSICEPYYESIIFSTSGTESYDENFYHRALYFPTNTIVTSTLDREQNKRTLKIAANKIDYNKVETSGFLEDLYNLDLILGDKTDVKGEIIVTETTTIKTPVKTYYDYIEKKSVTQYKYDYEKTKKSVDFLTKNGEFIMSLEEYENTDTKHYSFEVYYFEDSRKIAAKSVYIYSRTYHGYDSDGYSFIANITNADTDNKFKENQDLTFCLKGKQNEKISGNILYTTVKDKIISKGMAESNVFTVKYSDEYIPNYVLTGAYFNGKHIYSVNRCYMYYDYSHAELSIDIKADKEKYSPGEKVSLNVSVKDQAGNPVKANLLTSVIDRASDIIRSDYYHKSNLLSEFYDTSYYNILTFTSFTSFSKISSDAKTDAGGENNGNNGVSSDYIRRKFADNAEFKEVITDANGKAKVTFTMPDSMTGWKISCVATLLKNNKVSAGYSEDTVISTLPFYINPGYDKKITPNDDLVVSLRAAGIGDLEQEVNYAVTVGGVTKEISGKADDPAYLNFGKQPSGEHKILIKAKSGPLADAMEVTVKVIESRLTYHKNEEFDLKDGVNLKAARFPVNLTFFDKDIEKYLDTVHYLYSKQAGREDFYLASFFADAKLTELQGLTAEKLEEYYYGIKTVSWSDPDPLTTAKVLIGMRNYMNTEGCKNYLYEILYNFDSTEEEVSAAYMGLSALGEPLLSDMKALLNDKAFDIESKLRLATGIALLGDFETAANWYSQNVSPKIKQTGSIRYFDGSGGAEAKIEGYSFTADCLIFESAVHFDGAGKIADYLMANDNKKFFPNLEIMAYIEKNPPNRAEASMSYILNGKEIKIDFKEEYIYSLSMNENDLMKANFKELSGNIGVRASYRKSGVVSQSSSLSVNKSIDDIKTLKVGDEVTVTLKTDKGESFTISDMVPAGTRFVRFNNNDDGDFSGYEENGIIRIWTWNHYSGNISYTVRCVLPGEFYAENALVVSDTGAEASSNSVRIVINP